MTDTTAAVTFKHGDLFTVDPTLYPASCHGVIYRVTKTPRGANGVNYTGEPVAWSDEDKAWVSQAGQRGVRAPAYAMTRHDPFDRESTPSRLHEQPYVPLPIQGALVRVPKDRPVPEGLYVVTGYPRGRVDAVQLTKLGGAGGRYYRACSPQWFEVIDPNRVRID